MFDTRYCRFVSSLAILTVGCFAMWMLSGCPGPPAPIPYITEYRRGLPSFNYQPLLRNNATSVPDPFPLYLLPSDDFTKLIDLNEFSFTAYKSCNATTPMIMAIIHSAPTHTELRRVIRLTWGQPLELVFLVGETKTSRHQAQIDAEIKEFGDIVQGNFKDSYRNLTYKHVMGLKWLSYHCPGARYILKTDDDVFVNTPYLMKIIQHDLSPLGGRRLILCYVLKHTLVFRSYRAKWRVSPKEYPGRWYPPYCAGWAIFYTPDVAFTLYNEAQRTPYFWIDDVHITGDLVTHTNFTHTHLGRLSKVKPNVQEILSNDGPIDFLFGLQVQKEFFNDLWTLAKKLHPLFSYKSDNNR